MRALITCWKLFWCGVATPFAYIVVIIAVIGCGPKAAREWAYDADIPWPF